MHLVFFLGVKVKEKGISEFTVPELLNSEEISSKS